MGIKNIHIVLISCSTLIAVLFGFWGIRHDYVAMGLGAWVVAFGLVVYGINFLKKVKAL